MIYAKTPRQCERREKDAVTLVGLLRLINTETDGEALDVDIHTYIHAYIFCSNIHLRHKVAMRLRLLASLKPELRIFDFTNFTGHRKNSFTDIHWSFCSL